MSKDSRKVRKKAKLRREKSRPARTQVAGCPEGPRYSEKGGVFRAEKVRRA